MKKIHELYEALEYINKADNIGKCEYIDLQKKIDESVIQDLLYLGIIYRGVDSEGIETWAISEENFDFFSVIRGKFNENDIELADYSHNVLNVR